MKGVTRWYRNRRFAVKFILLATLPILVCAVSLSYVLFRSIEQSLAEALVERIGQSAKLTAQSMSHSYVIYNKNLLDGFVDSLAGEKDIRYALVLDYSDRRILSHSDHQKDGRVAGDDHGDAARVFWGDNEAMSIYRTGKDMFEATIPIRIGGELFGSLKVGFDLKRVKHNIMIMQRNGAGIVLLAVVLSLLLSVFLARLIGKPILALARQAREIAQGDLDQTMVYDSRDELGDLARSFRTMAMDLKQRIFALSENEEKYRALFEGANDAVLIVDRNHTIEDFNRQARNLFACESGKIAKKNLDLFCPENQPDGSGSAQTLDRRIKRVIDGESRRFYWKLKRSDQTEFDSEMSMSPTLIFDTPMVQVVIRDITERKKAEAEIEEWNRTLEQRVSERTRDLEDAQEAMLNLVEDLNESKTDLERSNREVETQKAYLEHLFKASPEAIALVDSDGAVVRVNRQFSMLFGYTLEECLGRSLDELIVPRGHEPEAGEIMEGIKQGYAVFHETKRRKKGGDLVDVSLTGVAIEIDDENCGLYIICRDISERKKAESALQEAQMAAEAANRAKGEFLANMSHEIRTPMNAIVGLTYLTMQTDLSPRQFDYLNKIESSAQSLLGVINDILDFSKIEAGRMTMETMEFYLDDVLEKVADLTNMKADEKGLELVFESDTKVPQELVGDPLRLAQILVNFVGNAVKFTENGEVVVRSRVIDETPSRVRLEFQVRDTGIGLDGEQRSRLFKAFSQADTSTTRKFGGTGLGLVICQRLVTMMNGEIRLDSEPGKGSTFSFTAEFARHAKKRETARIFAEDFAGMRALIVDDSVTARQSMKRVLESFRLHVDAVGTGRDALDLLERATKQARPYDLVLTDWKMPLMDGIETAKHIKERKDSPDIPVIIMVTAYGREDVLAQAEEIGLDGFITKPVSPSTLLDAIMDAFGKGGAVFGKDREFSDHDKGLDRIAGARILLAEDNDVNRQVATELLESVGLTVICASNGQDVLSRMEEEGCDAILMDIQMPVMDGFETTRHIREMEAAKHKPPVPIIALTAHAMIGDREKSLKAGMNDHVTKPLDPEKLFACLSRWVAPTGNTSLLRIAKDPKKASSDKPGRIRLSLPGIDVERAVKRMGGNMETFIRLAGMFVENQKGSVDRIKAALDAGDDEGARQLVHSLKGVSGNLGAGELYASAMDLEKAIRTGERDLWGQYLENTGDHLEKAVRQFETLDKETLKKTMKQRKDKALAVHHPGAWSSSMEKLGAMIAQRDYLAGKYLKSLYDLAPDKGRKAALERVGACLATFDYDGALEHMGALKTIRRDNDG